MGYTKLDKTSGSFSDMIKEFGAVTVMNAKIYEPLIDSFENSTAEGLYAAYLREDILAEIDSLKIANITVDGPSKTVTGGQYSNPLIKFGKTARLEMQDALGRADAIEAFGGGVVEYSDSAKTSIKALHITEDFAGPKTIIGDTFFIERGTGKQVPVTILIYQVLPDSIFNLTQDAEGDATVFDMNADVLTTTIQTYDKNTNSVKHGVFYSIISGSNNVYFTVNNNVITATNQATTEGVSIKVDGAALGDSNKNIAKGTAVRITAEKDNKVLQEAVVVGK